MLSEIRRKLFPTLDEKVHHLNDTIRKKDVEGVREILRKEKFNPDQQFNFTNMTSFRIALKAGAYDIVSLFLEYGIDINQNIDSFNHLEFSLTHNISEDITMLLLENGATSYCALHLCRNKYTAVSKWLIDRDIGVNHIDRYGQTPLFYTKDNDIIDALIAKGVDVNHKDLDANTAMDCCLKNLHLNVFNYNKNNELLKLLTVGARCKQQYLPILLLSSIMYGNYQIPNILTEQGVDINSIINAHKSLYNELFGKNDRIDIGDIASTVIGQNDWGSILHTLCRLQTVIGRNNYKKSIKFCLDAGINSDKTLQEWIDVAVKYKRIPDPDICSCPTGVILDFEARNNSCRFCGKFLRGRPKGRR